MWHFVYKTIITIMYMNNLCLFIRKHRLSCWRMKYFKAMYRKCVHHKQILFRCLVHQYVFQVEFILLLYFFIAFYVTSYTSSSQYTNRNELFYSYLCKSFDGHSESCRVAIVRANSLAINLHLHLYKQCTKVICMRNKGDIGKMAYVGNWSRTVAIDVHL
jgi:hypothetical protein